MSFNLIENIELLIILGVVSLGFFTNFVKFGFPEIFYKIGIPIYRNHRILKSDKKILLKDVAFDNIKFLEFGVSKTTPKIIPLSSIEVAIHPSTTFPPNFPAHGFFFKRKKRSIVSKGLINLDNPNHRLNLVIRLPIWLIAVKLTLVFLAFQAPNYFIWLAILIYTVILGFNFSLEFQLYKHTFSTISDHIKYNI